MVEKKGTEFSKKILIVSYTIAIALTVTMCVMMVMHFDVNPLVSVVLACWGEVTVGNAFYYWKARSENKIKMLSGTDQKVLDKIMVNLDKDM